jgi:drug/metabolite transporter (DMT)-like permease
MWLAAGLILAIGGLVVVLFGAFTMVYAGDVEGDEPAVGTGVAIALTGVVAMALGIWIITRLRRAAKSRAP